MPHLTIEYTSNLRPNVELSELFARLHDVLAEVGNIKKANCKSRATELDQFYLGDGEQGAAFVHADLRFLEGRSSEAKREIGRSVLAILQESYPPAAGICDLQITVEVRDIERSTYFKYPKGSLDYK